MALGSRTSVKDRFATFAANVTDVVVAPQNKLTTSEVGPVAPEFATAEDKHAFEKLARENAKLRALLLHAGVDADGIEAAPAGSAVAALSGDCEGETTQQSAIASPEVTESPESSTSGSKNAARLRAAIEAVDAIIWTNNAAGEMIGDQPGWSALTGQSRAEHEGFGWTSAVHPDDVQPTLDAWQTAVHERRLFDFEHRVCCRDGEWRHFSIRAAPILDRDGQIVEWVGVHRDISARKAWEAHQELLMRELAHRSKNQLAVIQGVAGLTARHARSLEEFRETFSKRLNGMAISTDLLVARDWVGAPLGDLVRQQLESFGTDDDRLKCDGPLLLLGSDAAESLGLALHELATNCIKYGAWSVPKGKVSVFWALDHHVDQPAFFRVSWIESGGPEVVEPNRQGFGRRVIQDMVAQKLNGKVELKFEPDGVKWHLTAPVGSNIA